MALTPDLANGILITDFKENPYYDRDPETHLWRRNSRMNLVSTTCLETSRNGRSAHPPVTATHRQIAFDQPAPDQLTML